MAKSYQQALFEQLYHAPNGNGGSGGGATDDAEAKNRDRFSKSPVGIWAMQQGLDTFEEMYNKTYHGGGFTAKRGQQLTDKDYQNFLKASGGGQQGQATKTVKSWGKSGAVTGADGVRRYTKPGEKPKTEGLSEAAMRLYQEQFDASNAANEDRYGDILRDLRENQKKGLDTLAGYGQSYRTDIEEQSGANLAKIKAGLAARGLADSTILSAFELRGERDKQTQNMKLDDLLAGRELDYRNKTTADIAGFMERRNDIQPDQSQLLALLEKFGKGNGGQGFNSAGQISPTTQQSTTTTTNIGPTPRIFGPESFQRAIDPSKRQPVFANGAIGTQRMPTAMDFHPGSTPGRQGPRPMEYVAREGQRDQNGKFIPKNPFG